MQEQSLLSNINWSLVFWYIVVPFAIAIAILIVLKVVKYLIEKFFWIWIITAIVWFSIFMARKVNLKSDNFHSTGNLTNFDGQVMTCALQKYYFPIGIAVTVIIVVAVTVRLIVKRRYQAI